jgi:hypothetical protein
MLVLNPKWSASLPAYGYRIGFSKHELRLLNDNMSCRLWSLAKLWGHLAVFVGLGLVLYHAGSELQVVGIPACLRLQDRLLLFKVAEK